MTDERAAVPGGVQALPRGRPQAGAWDPVFLLLTVDVAGFPHVCLLSRAQFDAGMGVVRAVIASPGTVSNLRRTGLATLIVVGSETAWYCKLRVAAPPIEVSGLLGVAFTVPA
jgi:hypothetical protein